MKPSPKITIEQICPAIRDQLEDLSRRWRTLKYVELVRELGSIFSEYGGTKESFCELAAQIIYPYKDPVQAVTNLRMMVDTSEFRREEIEAGTLGQGETMIAVQSRQAIQRTVTPKTVRKPATRRSVSRPKKNPEIQAGQGREEIRRTIADRFEAPPKRKPKVHHSSPDKIGRSYDEANPVKKKSKTKRINKSGLAHLSTEEADELMKSLSEKWSGATFGQKIIDMKRITNYAKKSPTMNQDAIAEMVHFFSKLPLASILPFVQIAIRLDAKQCKLFNFKLAEDLSLEEFVECFNEVNYDFDIFIKRISNSAKKTGRLLTRKGLMAAYHAVV